MHENDNYCIWIDQIHKYYLTIIFYNICFEKHQLHKLCSLFKFDFVWKNKKEIEAIHVMHVHTTNNTDYYLLKIKSFFDLKYWSDF